MFLALHSLLTVSLILLLTFSEEAWLLNPHEAPTGNQSPGLQVEEIWPIHLLWESLHLSHLPDVSDNLWTCGPQSCGKTM